MTRFVPHLRRSGDARFAGKSQSGSPLRAGPQADRPIRQRAMRAAGPAGLGRRAGCRRYQGGWCGCCSKSRWPSRWASRRVEHSLHCDQHRRADGLEPELPAHPDRLAGLPKCDDCRVSGGIVATVVPVATRIPARASRKSRRVELSRSAPGNAQREDPCDWIHTVSRPPGTGEPAGRRPRHGTCSASGQSAQAG
jgi:hypothetical protein